MIATQSTPYSHEDLVEQLTQKPSIQLDSASTANQHTLAQLGAASTRFYSHALTGGNSTMLVAMIGLLLCILVGYSYADSFSLWAQVGSHIGLILFATAVKIGYVMRCIGLDGMGHLQL